MPIFEFCQREVLIRVNLNGSNLKTLRPFSFGKQPWLYIKFTNTLIHPIIDFNIKALTHQAFAPCYYYQVRFGS